MALLGHYLFFALMPGIDVGRAILSRVPDYSGKMLRERLHMTIAITPLLQSVHREFVEAMLEVAAGVSSPPIDITLDRMDRRGRWIGISPRRKPPNLQDLWEQLTSGMRRLGVPLNPKEFNPHVTVAYQDGPAFGHPVRPVEWRATQLVLIESLVGLTIHRELGRWPLDAPAPRDLFSDVA